MVYRTVNIIIYIVCILLSMYGLQCVHFDKYIRKGKTKEFYLLYIILSTIMGYLLGSFLIEFMSLSTHLI